MKSCGQYLLLSLLLLASTQVNASTNLLSDTWISCDDNNRTRIARESTIQLNSECLYQEVEARQNDRFDLECETRTNDLVTTELAYSDQNFQPLRSAIDVTSRDQTLRVNSGNAPQNTRYAVVALFASGQATFSCTLSAPNQAQATNPGTCIDSNGDGYGWNGTATCTPDSSPTTSAPSTTGSVGACIDPDNDGYGWNGVDTCSIGGTQGNDSANPDQAPRIDELTDLILVTGQSNAQGNESIVSLAVLDAPNNKVFAFTDENGWQVADLRQHWDGPNEKRHPGNNALVFPTNTPHNNFSIHFGKSLIAIDSQRVVGFVLATAPGAGIKYWDKGSFFYNALSNKAMTALNASNKTSFDGILWHQGETDFIFNGTSDITATQAEKFAPNYYPDKLYRLISNLRQEPWFDNNKPVFICGETQKTNSDPTTIAPVNRRLMALNNDGDRYTGCVSADGLQTSDGTHFNASALREIGRRYAAKYVELKQR